MTSAELLQPPNPSLNPSAIPSNQPSSIPGRSIPPVFAAPTSMPIPKFTFGLRWWCIFQDHLQHMYINFDCAFFFSLIGVLHNCTSNLSNKIYSISSRQEKRMFLTITGIARWLERIKEHTFFCRETDRKALKISGSAMKTRHPQLTFSRSNHYFHNFITKEKIKTNV